jgi:aspartate 1-decarboxylase
VFDNLIENDQQIVISYVLNSEQELENLLCYLVEFDRENKLIHVQTTYGTEYIFPLSVIRQIELKKRR